MDTRALFEMKTSTFCPARERRNYFNRDDDRKWNKWGGGGIFMKVFLSKRFVNIGMTHSIQDKMLGHQLNTRDRSFLLFFSDINSPVCVNRQNMSPLVIKKILFTEIDKSYTEASS